MHFPQARFGGVTEYAQIAFEKRGLAFPLDWPGTRAGEGEETRVAGGVRGEWEKRPVGKRESWDRVVKGGEIGDPFSCDWDLLFREKEGGNVEKQSAGKEETRGIEAIRAQAKAAMQPDAKSPGPLPDKPDTHFLLSPTYAKQLLTRTSPVQAPQTLDRALLPIRLHFLQKGSVVHRARIYRLPTDSTALEKWTALAKSHVKVSKGEYPTCPGEEDLLGFVTTGNVSLAEGRGRAVGALAWERVVGEETRWAGREERRWCIVRDVGKDIGRLARWEVND
jgi:ribonuclease P/MRP protein subunit POP1